MKVSATPCGLTGSGSMTSVNTTPVGTVSSMRANKSVHVDAKSLGDSAKLSRNGCVSRDSQSSTAIETHLRIVALLSLEKMRLSEFVVSL